MPSNHHPEHRASFTLDPTTIITLVTLVAALLAAKPVFFSIRPPSKPVQVPGTAGVQKVDWRIQDDPLAVLKNRASEADVQPKLAFPGEQTAGTPQKKLGLAIMLPGGSSTEDNEARIRARHAVTAGLIELGYGAEDPDRIGIWKWGEANDQLAPFEHFAK
ncbi:MAG TPA: hypothetical protein VF607_15720, partial [Verrucomicrobiae bacterium]